MRDDRTLFKFLILERAQAVLSRSTILKKRDSCRRALDASYPARIATCDGANIAEQLTNPGIVRNQAKVAAASPSLGRPSVMRLSRQLV